VHYNPLSLGAEAPPFISLSCVIACIAALGAVIGYVRRLGFEVRHVPTEMPTAALCVTLRDIMLMMSFCFAVVWVYVLVLPSGTGALNVVIKMCLLVCPLLLILAVVMAIRAHTRSQALNDALGLEQVPISTTLDDRAATPAAGLAAGLACPSCQTRLTMGLGLAPLAEEAAADGAAPRATPLQPGLRCTACGGRLALGAVAPPALAADPPGDPAADVPPPPPDVASPPPDVASPPPDVASPPPDVASPP
jgi:hypothetical protein